MRLKSPDNKAYESPRTRTPGDRQNPSGNRPGSLGPYQRPDAGHITSATQMASSKALWGREHGDKPSEKIGNSTYRQEFMTYAVDNHERIDREKYRENFNSLAERDIYRGGVDSLPLSRDSKRFVFALCVFVSE